MPSKNDFSRFDSAIIHGTDSKVLFLFPQVEDFVKFLAKEATDELIGFDRSGKPKSKTEL